MSEQDKRLVWRGKVLATLGDIMNAVVAVKTQAEADQFLEAYRSINAHADDNIGYLLGYLSREEATRLFTLFRTPHPMLSGPGGYDSSPREAFETGMNLGGDGEEGGN